MFLRTAELREPDVQVLVRAELERLMQNRAAVGRPRARQWAFFTSALALAMGTSLEGPPPAFGAQRAAQYRFEVEDRLRRYYQRPGLAVACVFLFVHTRDFERLGVEPDYPAVEGYAVLVRLPESRAVHSVAEALQALVADAIVAELTAYRRLPEVDLDVLRPFYVEEGSAWRQIVHVLERHREKGWVLTNPGNPSTCRLLSARVVSLGPDEATLHTQEYVYLRWWSLGDGSYAYPYRETNRQRYILVRTPAGWRIEANLRPPPRSAAPHRRARPR